MGDGMMLILGFIAGFLSAAYGSAKVVEDALHTGYQDGLKDGAQEQEHAAWLIGETITAYDECGVKTWAVKHKCSKCGFVAIAIEAHMGQYSYCPSCGVKMDKEIKDGEV